MPKVNAAQKFLFILGVPIDVILFGHKISKRASNTKKGPGRVHYYGKIQ